MNCAHNLCKGQVSGHWVGGRVVPRRKQIPSDVQFPGIRIVSTFGLRILLSNINRVHYTLVTTAPIGDLKKEREFHDYTLEEYLMEVFVDEL